MSQHVFIVMPFGEKEGINFNAIYQDLIKPALLHAGLSPFRADEETLPGDIRADMFQELLMADLVIADLSIYNPNAWYELGVRHGLRAHGVIQIRSDQAKKIPFDVCVDRTIHYHLKQGAPDPKFLKKDREQLAKIAIETLSTHSKRNPTSPVYQYLPYLKEPDWKSLRVSNADDFWQQHEQWASQIEIAKNSGKPGDIVVLADEAPTYALKLEGYRIAGNALLSLEHYKFSLEQFEKALTIDPDDLESAQKKGLLLGRLNKPIQAEQWLRRLSKKHADNAETWGLLGRIEKECWLSLWRDKNQNPKNGFKKAKRETTQLNEAILAYRQGFMVQPENFYTGINALTLAYLSNHLQEQCKNKSDLITMAGGIRWAIHCELSKEAANEYNYWARVSLADLELLVSDNRTIQKSYKYAITAARQDSFALDSSRQQLKLLQDLGFKPKKVAKAIRLFDKAINNIKKPQNWKPRKVFLFSGHMIDSPERKIARFPPQKESIAAKAILKQLKKLGAGPKDLAICGGACGGDLLFAEAALSLNLHLELRLPFGIAEFIQNSVSFAGDKWRDRFYQVKDNPDTSLLIMPDELGNLAKNSNPYERNNLWQLYSALSWGIEKVHCICLWDGKGGDGLGGTRHMHNSIKQRSGQVTILATDTLFNLKGTSINS